MRPDPADIRAQFCHDCGAVRRELADAYRAGVDRAPIPAWARPRVDVCDCNPDPAGPK